MSRHAPSLLVALLVIAAACGGGPARRAYTADGTEGEGEEGECDDPAGDEYGVGDGCRGPDCEPLDPEVYPGALEVCGNARRGATQGARGGGLSSPFPRGRGSRPGGPMLTRTWLYVALAALTLGGCSDDAPPGPSGRVPAVRA